MTQPTPHPHAALITEWGKDTSRVVQYKDIHDTEWIDCPCPKWHHAFMYRFKPAPVFPGMAEAYEHHNGEKYCDADVRDRAMWLTAWATALKTKEDFKVEPMSMERPSAFMEALDVLMTERSKTWKNVAGQSSVGGFVGGSN